VVVMPKLFIMKKITNIAILVSALLFYNCSTGNSSKDANKKVETNTTVASTSVTAVVHLTTEEFKKNVFDYTKNTEWKYEGDKPCIIDFYATWCGPCKMMAPILEELAKEYSGKIIVYKIDTDQERDLAQAMGIQALPTLVFVPSKGKPHATQGAMPKDEVVKAINEILLTK